MSVKEGDAQQTPATAPKKRVRRSTAKGLRVKTGCITCRRRHLKCDEAKPICRNCSKGSRDCTYETSSSLVRPRRTSTISNNSTSTATLSPTSSVCDVNPFDLASSEINFTKETDYNAWSGPSLWLSLIAANSVCETPGLVREEELSGKAETFNALRLQLPLSPTSLDDGFTLLPRGFTGMTPGAMVERGVPVEMDRLSQTCQPQIRLESHEILLYRNYVEKLSYWLDVFDSSRYFTLLVPRLALHNHCLLKSLLAFSAKQTSRLQSTYSQHIAISYYNATLSHLSLSFHSPTSDELFATAIIVATYELLSSSLPDWHRHSRGIFALLRSQGITGESGGLKEKVFWSWLRQDVWAAVREGKKCRLEKEYWCPRKELRVLTGDEACNRVVYLLALVVNFALDGVGVREERVREYGELEQALDDWRRAVPGGFEPVTRVIGDDGIEGWWFHPQPYGAAIQVWHTAKVMLALNKPRSQPLNTFQDYKTLQTIRSSCTAIVSIAASGLSDECSIISSQCLYAVGACIEDENRRRFVLRHMEDCQMRTGWEFGDLRSELVRRWGQGDSLL